MIYEVHPTMSRLVFLTSSRLAELAQIACVLELDSQAEFFVEAAYDVVDGSLKTEDLRQAINTLRVIASKRDNGRLTCKQRHILGLAAASVLAPPRTEHYALCSPSERSMWQNFG